MRRQGVLLLLALGWLAGAQVRAGEPAAPASGPVRVTIVEEAAPAKGATPVEEQLAKKLQSPLSVQFAGTPLRDALRYFEDKGKVNVILNTAAPGVDPLFPITLKLDNVTLASAIAWTARLAGLVYIARDEAAFLTTPIDLGVEWTREVQARDQANDRAAEKSWAPKLREKLEEPTAFGFVNTPLAEALTFLSARHQVNIVLDPAFARPGNTVTLEVNDISLRSALGWLLRMKRLDYISVDEAIYVSSPDRLEALQIGRAASSLDPRLSTMLDVELSEATVQKALAALGEATGVNITLQGEQVPAVHVSLHMNHVTLEQAIKKLVAATGLPSAVSVGREGIVIRLEPKKATPAQPEAPKPPAEEPKAPSGTGQPDKEAKPGARLPHGDGLEVTGQAGMMLSAPAAA
jgi:hypothetical protein